MKKFLSIILALHLLIYGGTITLAAPITEEPASENKEVATNVVQEESTEKEQTEAPSDADNASSDPVFTEGDSQESDTLGKQTQEQVIEAIQEEGDLHQEITGEVNQEQTISTDNEVASGNQDQDTNTTGLQYQSNKDGQSQQVDSTAEQKQSVDNATNLDATQNQTIDLHSEQTDGEETDLSSNIGTEQSQHISIEGEVDYAEQDQEAHLKIKQETTTTKSEHLVDVETKDSQKVETTGEGSLTQNQSVVADGNIIYEGKKADVSLEAVTSNAIKIIKDATKTIIEITQSIFVKEEKSGQSVKGDYTASLTFDSNPISNIISKTINFFWGTVTVETKASVEKSDDENELLAKMQSWIFFDFFEPVVEPEPELEPQPEPNPEPNPNPNPNPNPQPEPTPQPSPDPKPVPQPQPEPNPEPTPEPQPEPAPQPKPEPSPGTKPVPAPKPEVKPAPSTKPTSPIVKKPTYPKKSKSKKLRDSDGDGISDIEERRLGTDPYKSDTDGDMVPDYLEVYKFHTDPNEIDTDGDGLTDLFEIVFHDSKKTELFEILKHDEEKMKEIEKQFEDFELEHYQLTLVLEMDEIAKALFEMEYEPVELNPAKADTDGNDVPDGEEDFDEDGISNEMEQQNRTIPYPVEVN